MDRIGYAAVGGPRRGRADVVRPHAQWGTVRLCGFERARRKLDDAIGYWILGFWSGLNGANDALVGDTTTANGVVGEVKLYCAAHPSVGLAQATLDTYAAMKKVRKR